jgi:hypothetical protein
MVFLLFRAHGLAQQEDTVCIPAFRFGKKSLFRIIFGNDDRDGPASLNFAAADSIIFCTVISSVLLILSACCISSGWLTVVDLIENSQQPSHIFNSARVSR